MADQHYYKGSLKTIILKLLHDQEMMYGYEITQKVKELTKGKLKITEGALYPALHKLESEGYLQAEIFRVDNRNRKYYQITEKGNIESEKKINELREFINTLETIIKPKMRMS